MVSEISEITLAASTTKINSLKDEETKEEEEDLIHNIVQDRKFMASHFLRQGKDCRYAIKTVKESSRKSAELYVNAVVDLAIEARFLAVIRHPNIIKMRGMATISPCDDKFFIILDKLFDTLAVRLKIWKKRLRKVKGVLSKIVGSGEKYTDFWGERLAVAYDLSCGLSNMHDMSIIYRDIKPDNIGFDVRGDVKIFDFGLAKELKAEDRSPDGTFKMTADTGSPRYMAPEVFLAKPYNETCDVYSFCILVWQILKLEIPYEDFTERMIINRVCKRGVRPKVDPEWSNQVNECLTSGWTGQVNKRASMEEISGKLSNIILQETGEEMPGVVDASRKSVNSM